MGQGSARRAARQARQARQQVKVDLETNAAKPWNAAYTRVWRKYSIDIEYSMLTSIHIEHFLRTNSVEASTIIRTTCHALFFLSEKIQHHQPAYKFMTSTAMARTLIFPLNKATTTLPTSDSHISKIPP